MTDQDNTEAVPTESAESDTTMLSPTTQSAFASAEAWSLDDTAEVESHDRSSRLVWSALVGLVLVVAGALIFLGTKYFNPDRSQPVEPEAKPTPSESPAPPSTVTVTAEPPPAPSVVAPTTTVVAPSSTAVAAPMPPNASDPDSIYLAKLANAGVPVPIPVANDLVISAHEMCAAKSHGTPVDSLASSFQPAFPSYSLAQMRTIAGLAIANYCPGNSVPGEGDF
jgi:Protein of unknown function (DUF732)